MKIAMEGNWLLGGRPGGIETYVRELARRLPALAPSHTFQLRFGYLRGRHRATIAEFAEAGWRTAARRVPSALVEGIAWRTGFGPRWLYGSADVVFLPYSDVSPGLGGRKIVATLHDLIPMTHPEFSTPELCNRFNSRIRQSLARCDAIICVSEYTRQQAIDRLGIAADRIVSVPNGGGTEYRRIADETVIARTLGNLGIAQPYVLHVGVIEPRKNLVRLIRAFDRTIGQAADLQLVLAGKPAWGTAEVERAIAEATDPTRVRLLGPVTADDLPALYSGALGLVYPSRAEGFGIPPLEAMACGCPVLAADATSIPEVVGDAGHLFDPHNESAIADAIIRLCNDPDWRINLRQRGEMRARTYSWERTARETLHVLETV